MDTVRAGNKGYSAEMLVVTFNHVKKTVHDGSKIKILLVSSQQISLSISHQTWASFCPHLVSFSLLYHPTNVTKSSLLGSFILFATPSPWWCSGQWLHSIKKTQLCLSIRFGTLFCKLDYWCLAVLTEGSLSSRALGSMAENLLPLNLH